MFAIAELAEALREPRYAAFVQKYCDFTMETLPLFRKQFFTDHDFQTSNYRMFRKGMLDDAGAPTLPFMQLAMKSDSSAFAGLVCEMAAYVSHGQVRLPDGTLCRPEPEPNTIWADDLFMSVPLLLRFSRWTDDSKYADDAAMQVLNFHRYLFDAKYSVFRHCYYADRGQQSSTRWGRANGWVIWATTEALKHLPMDHPARPQIIVNFQQHMAGLVRLQDSSGMWHQILDERESYEETSCTAMYIIGMARGMKYGWLDARYEAPLQRAWNALAQRVSIEGIVRDITAGTSVSEDPEYYRKRPRLPNDPRGLGGVITACKEMMER
jgi:rhamnogalacturonyl hydrolase YesR